ncbi:MAG: hypothetical protein NZM26_04905 [Patescibacteria group bacterium]|nr:hypothetical protein [Patescibacteria group bacterium]
MVFPEGNSTKEGLSRILEVQEDPATKSEILVTLVHLRQPLSEILTIHAVQTRNQQGESTKEIEVVIRLPIGTYSLKTMHATEFEGENLKHSHSPEETREDSNAQRGFAELLQKAVKILLKAFPSVQETKHKIEEESK